MPIRLGSSVVRSGLVVLAAAMSQPARPAVVSSSDAGFLVREEVVFAGPAQAAWDRLVRVQDWWDSEHTWSGDAANLSLALEPGGCWCERLPRGGVAQHMRVVFLQPGSVLRLAGGLGPLQGMGVAGSMTFSLKPDADHAGSTRVVVQYAVGGYSPEGFAKLAAAVDGVLGAQMNRYAKAS